MLNTHEFVIHDTRLLLSVKYTTNARPIKATSIPGGANVDISTRKCLLIEIRDSWLRVAVHTSI